MNKKIMLYSACRHDISQLNVVDLSQKSFKIMYSMRTVHTFACWLYITVQHCNLDDIKRFGFMSCFKLGTLTNSAFSHRPKKACFCWCFQNTNYSIYSNPIPEYLCLLDHDCLMSKCKWWLIINTLNSQQFAADFRLVSNIFINRRRYNLKI
jgi:hypothetical protein